ncbi:MAG TPA: class I SAM-dependent rRNA methyltransferase [Bacteroidia bacterium]|nr:class I SAM-dependent rRNA methyltransferase [Bacteroidia bacterium]
MHSERTQIILSSGKDQSLKRFHPWVFSGAIKKIKGPVNEGDTVDIFSNKDEFLGTGHYGSGSIAVRIFSFEQNVNETGFWNEKVRRAVEYRRNAGLFEKNDTNVFRLIYAEGDGLPGLIVDFYNGVAVLQAHSAGMYRERNNIAAALKNAMGEQLVAVYDKSAESLHRNTEETQITNGYILGDFQGEGEVTENGNRFYIDWIGGQKTGFFIDQRDNRALLAQYSKGKKVANTFCYTGGFSVYAANAGASEVHSVDSSKKAIALTEKNVELNGIKNHTSFAMDTFDFLKEKDGVYDVIVLDPPAFAKSVSAKHHAVMGYKRLNAEAISKIKPGGILFTFSCSQVIDRKLFSDTIMSASIVAGRNVRVMHRLSQPADHPVNIFHPEGEYLKGLVLYVE